jgi:N-acetylglucosaminyldiphosphoundecaprenol N-acetyl-beta-D-mannosaminyltransferase
VNTKRKKESPLDGNKTAPPKEQTFYIGKIKITPLNLSDLLSTISCLRTQTSNQARLITFLNAHVFCLAEKNSYLQEIINSSRLVLVDGISIAWAAKILLKINIKRCIATHAFDALINADSPNKWPALLIGVSQPEIEKAANKINAFSKSTTICKAVSGFLSLDEYEKLLNQYRDIAIIFVGMGTPKSEYVCHLACKTCPKAIIWHIGAGTLQFYAGSKKRSPQWVDKAGLRWLYRFIFEKKARKRYLIDNPRFVYLILKYWLINKISRVLLRTSLNNTRS